MAMLEGIRIEREEYVNDDDYEQILEEIPRSTSAPPLLEELQKANGSNFDDSPFLSLHDDLTINPLTDIRLDEDYEEFYRRYSGVKKLPPPVENRQLYADSPRTGIFHHSPFLHNMGLDHSGLGSSLLPRGHHISQSDGHQQQRQWLDNSPDVLRSQQVSSQADGSHSRLSESSLSSAFSSLRFADSVQPVSSVVSSASSSHRPVTAARPGSGFGLGLGLGSDGASLGEHRRSASLSVSHSSSASKVLNSLHSFSGNGSLEHLLTADSMQMPSMGMPSSRSVGGRVGNDGIRGFDRNFLSASLSSDSVLSDRGANSSSVSYGAAMAARTMSRGSSHGLRSSSAAVDSMVDGSATDLTAYSRPFVPSSAPAGDSTPPHPGLDIYSHGGVKNGSIIHSDHQQSQRLQSMAASLRQESDHEQQQRLQTQIQLHMQMQAHAQAQMQMQIQRDIEMEERIRLQQQQQQLHQLQQQQQALSPQSAYLQQQILLRQLSTMDPRYSPRDRPVGHQPRGHARGGSYSVGDEWGLAGSHQQSQQLPMTGVCPNFLQGFCSRGPTCPFMHAIITPTMFRGAGIGQEVGSFLNPSDPIWSYGGSSRGAQSGSQISGRRGKGAGNNGYGKGDAELGLSNRESMATSPSSASQTPKYNSLEEVEGRIFSIAKDQHGCRFLQRKFDEGDRDDITKIFEEIKEHVIELMTDPFGNYLIQKLLEVCSDEQHLDVLQQITAKGDLISISLNMHGTRAVQKLIETIQGPLQVRMVTAALQSGVVALIKDLNGNHVVQRCLQKLSNEDSQFIFDAAANHCIEIATHRHGCCVLQRCIDFSSGSQRDHLVKEIAANSLVLGQDPFGNYVVQYILDLNLDWAVAEVTERLEGQYAPLAQQKFSSNVVEKCLKLGGDEHRGRIIKELIASPRLATMLQDPFANYVFQSALTVAKGSVHASLVDAIKPHSNVLKSSPYGKRILSRIGVRK